MGAVYRAQDTELGRDVALKVVLDETNPELVKRIRREARAASAFAHPNVATIFDVSEHEGCPFIVMELVEGRSLRRLLAEGELSQTQKLDIMKQVARALAAAHERGLVHRDVKPDNIVVRADGVAKLLDFGIAKAGVGSVDASAPTEQIAALTQTGTSVGSPAYMAPEQIQNRDVDGRADQFAWAVTAYELLAGQLPWKSRGSTFEVAASILHEQPVELGSVTSGLPEAALGVISRALSKSAENRFDDMHQLLEAMDAPETANGAAAAPKPARKAPWVPISLALAAICSGFVFVLQHMRSGDDPSGSAQVPASTDLTPPEPPASEQAKSAVASAALPSKPSIVRCPIAQEPACASDYSAWCDASGKRLACCVKGLVARADGRCECARGGVKSQALIDGGCTAAPTGDGSDLQRIVRAHFPNLRRCYEVALVKNPKLGGKISVAFRLSPEGRVYDAKLSQVSVPDVPLQDCVVGVFEQLSFEPPPNGDMAVDYPLDFSNDEKKR